MRLAINGQQLAELYPLREMLGRVMSLGVDAVELWPRNLPGGNTDEEKQRYETKDVKGAARVLRELGLGAACVTLGFDALPMALRRGGVSACTEALTGAVETAEALGSALVNCYLAGIPGPTFAEAAGPAAEAARKRRITIVLENEAHDDSATPEGMLEILDAVDSPALKTLYDPCNYYQAREEPYPFTYEALKDRIGYVHLKGGVTYRAGSEAHRGGTLRGVADSYIGYVPLSASAYDVAAVVGRLVRDGYRGFVTLEPHVPAQEVETFLAADLDHLRPLLDAGHLPPTQHRSE